MKEVLLLLDVSLTATYLQSFRNPLQGRSQKSDLSPVSCYVLRGVPVCQPRHCVPIVPSVRVEAGPCQIAIWAQTRADDEALAGAGLYIQTVSHHPGAGWGPAVARTVASYINTQTAGAGDRCRKR